MREQLLVSLKRNEQAAIGMITDQLWAGELGDGSIMPPYSPVSVAKFGKPPGPWRLYDQGDYYRGIFMQAAKFPVVFDNHDQKTGKIAEMLEGRGGNADEILTINEANKNDLARNYILTDLQNYLRSIIQLR